MKKNKSFVLRFTLLIGIVLCVCQNIAAEPVTKIKSDISLPGKYFLACSMAYTDFSEKLKAYSVKTSPLNSYLANIENYDVVISQKNGSYIVIFTPAPLDGRYLKGGGAEYFIDGADFKIVNKTYFK